MMNLVAAILALFLTVPGLSTTVSAGNGWAGRGQSPGADAQTYPGGAQPWPFGAYAAIRVAEVTGGGQSTEPGPGPVVTEPEKGKEPYRPVPRDDGPRNTGPIKQQQTPSFLATPDDAPAPSGGPEYVLVGTPADIADAETIAGTEGASMLRRQSLGRLGVAISVIDLNGAVTLNNLRAALARRSVSVTVDRNSLYGLAGGFRSYASALVGVDQGTPCRLPRPVRVGLIDGPVDASSPALGGVTILSGSVLATGDRQGSPDHATGIAALIASPGGQGVPSGIAPGAEIFSVVAFARSGGRDVARLENIAAALDWFIDRKVTVVNMSLAGPWNDALAQIIAIADAQGLIMIAATGNDQRPEVSYPASDPHVIAITAVDAAKRLFKKANYGEEVDFSAPGVDVLVSDTGGPAYRSGTSYATAIATALVAHEVGHGVISREEVFRALRDHAEDLGTSGHDARFGWGLIKLNGC